MPRCISTGVEDNQFIPMAYIRSGTLGLRKDGTYILNEYQSAFKLI